MNKTSIVPGWLKSCLTLRPNTVAQTIAAWICRLPKYQLAVARTSHDAAAPGGEGTVREQSLNGIDRGLRPRYHGASWFSVALCLSALTLLIPAFGQVIEGNPTVRFFKDSPVPQAVVLSINGGATFSEAGSEFKTLRVGDVLNQGAVIRVGENASADLFFRRLAITVRLVSDTELRLEKMLKTSKDGVPVMETTLDLQKGRIFCFVRSVIPNSKFEVRHSVGRAVVEGEGFGGYHIQADGAAVTGNSTFIPLKVISETGTSVVAPGEKFDAANKKVLRLAPSEAELTFMQLDELRALAELLSPQE
jgi:hypothetical protein